MLALAGCTTTGSSGSGSERPGASAAAARISPADLEQALTDGIEAIDQRFGIDLGGQSIALELVSHEELLELTGHAEAGDSLRAATEVELTYRGETLIDSRFRIVFRDDEDPEALLGVMVHELFHVAQGLHGGGSSNQAPALCEGSANYVQLAVIRQQGNRVLERSLTEDPDPIYGGGLRRFFSLVDRVGEREAIRIGLSEPDFPRGY